jgi:hypothetical protein
MIIVNTGTIMKKSLPGEGNPDCQPAINITQFIAIVTELLPAFASMTSR